MLLNHRHRYLLACCSIAALSFNSPVLAQAQPSPAEQMLMQRLQQLEQRLNQLEGRGGAAPPAAAPTPAPGAPLDTQAILDRLEQLDARIANLESATVLSEPKTIAKQVQQYVDPNGNVFD